MANLDFLDHMPAPPARERTPLPRIPRASRKAGRSRGEEVDAPDPIGDAAPGQGLSTAVYAKARATKEHYLAKSAELEFRRKSGEYVARASVQQACATAYSAVAQAMRSIPDNLERKLGVSPEIAQAVGDMIDGTLAELAEDLERIHAGRPAA